MSLPVKISGVIITYNEARNIKRCLDSLSGVVEELLVVDSFSTDDTVEIARSCGAKVLQHAFDGHIQQKNYAIGQATYNHILSLDADEALSPVLRDAILERKSAFPEKSAFSMNRLTNYAGQWIRYGGWYPDTKIRLFDRRMAQWGGENPHDKVILAEKTGKVIHLSGDLLHYSYYSVEEHRERSKKYADIAAVALRKSGKKPFFGQALVSAAAGFLKVYVLRLGFLEGKMGWYIATISALEKWRKYAR